MYKASIIGEIVGKRGNILSLVPKKNGYLHFSQSDGTGNPKQTLVHRFVWKFFNGDIPEGLVVDHIDGNRHNNCLANLQLMSQRENSRKDGNIITLQIADEIRSRRTNGEKGSNLAIEFGISTQLVCDIYKGRRWLN